jgi:hypothetical protein
MKIYIGIDNGVSGAAVAIDDTVKSLITWLCQYKKPGGEMRWT